jgi:succinyl-diaminopimelate desuccinylase
VSGKEQEVAQLIKEEMKKLGYDEVGTDRLGNVIGLVRGNKSKPSICFTAHMDTVPPGDESKWEYPPYSGTIADGYIHGRGAGDVKGPVATQVYIPALLRDFPVEHGDLYVLPVVQEEVGGLGSKYLDEDLLKKIDYAICGEATANQIHIGQRGRTELMVAFKGKSAHASRPWLGINPFYEMAGFISRLPDLKMAGFGEAKTTVVPTKCATDTETSNIIPGECRLTLDWRDVPGETEAQILQKLKDLLPENGTVEIAEYKLKTYTGLTLPMKRRKAPFLMERGHPLVEAVSQAIRGKLHRNVELRWWEGATDCGYFSDAGIPIVGFSPAEQELSHTSREKISLKMIQEAFSCYPAIIANISRLEKRIKIAGGDR